MYCWTFCLQSKWLLKVNYLYLTCLLFKKNNLLLKQFFAIKKANRRWIQFFTGSKSSKKVNSIFLARSQCSQHTNSTFFCMLEQVTQHSIQLFANWKRCKNSFCFHEKWIHHMGGGPKGPGQAQSACPPYDESIFHEKNIYFACFSVCKMLN